MTVEGRQHCGAVRSTGITRICRDPARADSSTVPGISMSKRSRLFSIGDCICCLCLLVSPRCHARRAAHMCHMAKNTVHHDTVHVAFQMHSNPQQCAPQYAANALRRANQRNSVPLPDASGTSDPVQCSDIRRWCKNVDCLSERTRSGRDSPSAPKCDISSGMRRGAAWSTSVKTGTCRSTQPHQHIRFSVTSLQAQAHPPLLRPTSRTSNCPVIEAPTQRVLL